MEANHPMYSAVWGAALDALLVDKGLLSPRNGAVDQLFVKNSKLAVLAKAFVDSLKNDHAPAGEARQLLFEIRALFHVGGTAPASASKFPTLTYNCLLEYVSAKRLFEAGTPWPAPGQGLNQAGVKKADYAVNGVSEDVEVGDHLVSRSGRAEPDLVEVVGGDVSSKLETYRTAKGLAAGRLVRVVIDVVESPAAQHADDSREAWQHRVAAAVKPLHAKELTAPLSLIVIVTAAHVHTFNRTDLGLS